MLTRRTLLQHSPALGLPLVALLARTGRAQPQQPQTQLSSALESRLLNLTLATIEHQSPRQYLLLADTFAEYFAELSSAGLTPQLQAAFQSSGLLGGITSEQILTIASQIETATGVPADLPTLTGWLNTMPILQTMISQSGCEAVHSSIVSLYRTLGATAVIRRKDPLDNESTLDPRALGGVCLSLNILGLYTGTWGLMSTLGYLTFLSAGTGGIVFAAAGLALAIAGAYC